MKELKILSPCGMLGYGFPADSFLKGVEKKPDLIAVDAGSTDAGPHKLGAGVGITSKEATRKDLEWILTWGYKLGIPVIIGSAGGAGAKTHVAWTLRIIEDIIKAKKLTFETAIIYADIPQTYVKNKWLTQQLEPLGPVPPLTETALENTKSIVGQMGCEPIIEALTHGAQLIVAGRAYDPAPFAALPIKHGFDPALAIHLGKILECGALCAEPGTTKDVMMGYLRADHFIVEPMNTQRICNPTSVAAHSLYEKSHPYFLYGPGFMLDLSACQFMQQTKNSVKVQGSRLTVAENYTIKLEGAAQVAYRTITIAGIRDPIIIANIEEITQNVKAQVDDYFDKIPATDFEVIFHIYGKNGVMGVLEPNPEPAHELGVVLEVVAKDQELANTICSFVRSTLLHYPCVGRKSTAGNLALLFSPSEITFGPVYQFTIHHLVTVLDPLELFTIEYKTLSG